MVQSGSILVQFNQHLVTLSDEAELQILHFLVRHHGSCLSIVEVLLNGIYLIDEQVVAYQRFGRLLRQWVELIAWFALVVQIDLLAVVVRHQFDAVVLLTLLAVETHVGQQTRLITVRTLRRVGADKLLRQCLSKEQQFIHVTLQGIVAILHLYIAVFLHHIVAGSTDERIATTDAAKAVGFEGLAQFLIHINVRHVAGAIHRHSEVVPLTIAPVAWHLCLETVRAVHQLVALESDVEQVLSTVVLLQSATVGEQRTTTVCIRLEPEHQRVVMLAGAVHGVLVEQHTLVCLLQVQ